MPLHLIGFEALYSVAVIVLCIFIYIKTKDLQDLSSHKGIKYFRHAFLFFGVAYLCRFLFIPISILNFGLRLFPPRYLMHFSLLLTTYFSTVAIMSLFYSVLWKKLDGIVSPHILAVLLALLVLFFNNPTVLILAQLGFFVLILLAAVLRKQPFNSMYIVYVLLFVFWLLNVVSMSDMRFTLFVRVILNLLSLGMFGLIVMRILRVIKWGKDKD